ncbi:DUF2804 domain-containing protein [Ruania albidiflava]|uniref:DUF2804 domain-containing protein n=2 Tax=Ruania albidiflava TaxID=366586 RepID=UPI0003B33147|nr:DUF2804 domain-containing protein [Ruania albidiflava]
MTGSSLLMRERELTEEVSLTLPDGRLNRGAIGWARQPLVDTAGIGRGRGRNKRWEYWGVVTPTHLLGLTVSHIDYAAVHELWLLERATERSWGQSATVVPPRGVRLPAVCEGGPARASAKNLALAVDEVDGGTRLRAKAPGVRVDLVAARPAGHERLAVVVPWSSRRFQYTVKDVARPVTGTIWLDDVAHEVPEGESWAVLDHGRGRWPYAVSWNWGAGSGISDGRVVGLQVGGRWTEGTGSTENAVLVDGRLHKLHGELEWDYDLAVDRPWRVSGRGLDAQFEAFYTKRSRTELGVLSSRTDQCFGHWSGSVRTGAGEMITFSGLLGWAEEVHNRW